MTGVAWGVPLGDANCDTCVNPVDIPAFVEALVNPAQYGIDHPGCPLSNVDCNGDTQVNGDDVQCFIPLLSIPIIPTRAQLAGNALGVYPFFEYVRAFNSTESVSLAIDPTRYPSIAGRTADIYIVNAKTDAQWTGDPSLTDVRGAAQTVTFPGGTIQADTFTIATPGQLASSGGTTDIGKGYDVVVDVNRNGVLDCGDFIDGLGDPEAGMYVVHDISGLGPLATTAINYTVTGVTAGFTSERTWYPSNIAAMGQVPLVVISHGNGHLYTWYDYLQQHLASYGYIVMSHQNNTGPGIETASTTTLQHTDAILGQQATIGGGVLNGHIDGHKIIWIGHSRGGEGVCRGYDRIFDATFVPTNYVLSDIRLVSSIAPTDFLGTGSADPHGVTYHLIYGSSDRDVGGYPNNDIADSFNLYERATGFRQATYVQGAFHNDFNCCGDDSGFADGTVNPAGTLIGKTEAQKVAKAVYLALIKHYIENNIPAKDYLWRQYEHFKPIGVASTTIVDNEYRPTPNVGRFVIDDYQTNTAANLSSSGGAVATSLANLTEGIMLDNDAVFTWLVSDPFNGMTRGRNTDTPRAVVFDWTVGDDRFYDETVIPAQQNWNNYHYISLRACQGTRHPETVAELADLTFSVVLVDNAAHSSTINIGAYGGGIEEPYQRTGYGSGAGWQNEFETIRIRLTDFLNNGSNVDLAHIATLRLRFGSVVGSSRGRVAIDDLQLEQE
ncbi:MAG: hypothetical protein U1A27_13575 [Phycisphaerae bacterium]